MLAYDILNATAPFLKSNNNNNNINTNINSSSPKPITLICLHGLGASKEDLQGLAPHLQLPEGSQLLFLQAPMKGITINNGLKMPAWYDISSSDLHRYEDIDGLEFSAQNIEKTCFELMQQQVLNWKNVYFLGFSQGCATSLYLQLYYQWKLLSTSEIKGIIGLSGYIPNANAWKALQTTFKQNIKEQQKQVPIFLAHGTNDDVVPFAKAELTLNVLQSVGYNVAWNTYNYRHEISIATLKDINRWFAEIL